MAMPALKFEPETPVEQRLARLEVSVENIQSDVTEIKTDIRRLVGGIDEVDKRLTGKIDEANTRLTGKIDEVNTRLTGKIDEVNTRLTGKIDALGEKMSAKIDEVDTRLSGKIDALDKKQTESFETLRTMIMGLQNSFADLKVSRANDRVWWLMISAALLGIMAHGLKWF